MLGVLWFKCNGAHSSAARNVRRAEFPACLRSSNESYLPGVTAQRHLRGATLSARFHYKAVPTQFRRGIGSPLYTGSLFDCVGERDPVHTTCGSEFASLLRIAASISTRGFLVSRAGSAFSVAVHAGLDSSLYLASALLVVLYKPEKEKR